MFNFAKPRKWFAALLVALLTAAMFVPSALAALPSFKSWSAVADYMDGYFDRGIEAYAAGDTKQAYKEINNAYFEVYEVTGFERTAMGYIAGSRKSQVEMQFSAAKSAIKKDAGADKVNEEVEKLRAMIREDAQKLDGTWTGEAGSSYTSAADLKNTAESAIETLKDYTAALNGSDALTTSEDAGAAIDMVITLLDSYGTEIADLKSELQTSYDNIDTLDADAVNDVIATLEDYSSSIGETASTGTSGGAGSPWVTFFACFGIILREGLEAILVVGAIIAYLVKSGNKDKLPPVYIGSVLAIAASFLAAWLLNALKLANAAPQEVIEGVTALIAVVVLFYVSNWMVSKSESAMWNRYIEGKVQSSVATGSMFALGFTAFLAVFREGAEVILFYQPLLATGNTSYVWGGFAVGCAVLVVVFLVIRFLSVKLPLKPFFLGTSILMFAMSISFLGSGIKELIEGNVLSMTPMLENVIPYNNVMDVLGIYPVAQTLIPQIILLIITIVTFVIQIRRNQKAKAELEKAGK